MSLTSEYLKAKQGGSSSRTSSSTRGTDRLTRGYLQNTAIPKKKKKDEWFDFAPITAPIYSAKDAWEEDIAPVKENKKLDFFQKSGAFSDGYQIGDITKTILGTAGDAGLEAVKGVGGLAEGITDLATYGAAKLADVLGGDELAEELRAEARRNEIEEMTKKTDDFLEKYSVLGRTSDSILQGLGQVGGIIATGGAGAAAGLGTAGVTALTTGTMFASGTGSGMSEAYEGGATDEEAVQYGLISGAADAISELMFGGLGKMVNAVGLSRGLSSADDMLAKWVSSKLTSQISKNFAEFGIKASAEGMEEVVSGIAQAAGKKLTYMSDEDINKLLADENLLEQFIVGAATSGMIQSGIIPSTKKGSLAEANSEGRDFITGLNQDEQTVVDFEVNRRIAEEEQDRKKLTTKEKNAIEEKVLADLDKGLITVDTIEEALGGDTYKAYNALAREAEEFTTLYNTESGKLSRKDQDRLAELLEKDKANPYKNALQTARDNLSQSVYGMAQNSRLIESYNEQGRKGQAFEADISKYDAKQQATIQKAIDSGVLNNTNRTHQFVDLIARITADKGVSFDFTNNENLKNSGFAIEGRTVNGFVNKNGVTININSAKALEKVVGHEITHVLEETEVYTELQSALFAYAKDRGDYDKRIKSLTETYKGIEGADINAELTADLVGDYLFTDTDFVNRLSTEHRNIFQKIYDEIKYLCKVVTAGSKEARQLEKVKRAFDEAYRAKENTATTGGVKYSITEPFTDTSGTHFENAVLLDTDFFDGISPRKWGEQLKAEVNKRASTEPFILPIVDESGNTTLLRFASPDDRVKKDGGARHRVLDKLSSTPDNISKLAVIHIDEIVSVSEENSPYYTNENNHQWLDENGWLHRNANVINQKNGNIYNLTVDIAKAADGRTILYATDGKIKKVGNVNVDSLNIKGPRQNSDSNDIIGQNAESVKPKFSLSVSDDNAYLDAVNRGDMKTAQSMVYEAAKQAGYTDDSSWKMMHTAPNSKDDISLVDLKESGLVPDDYWSHPEWYTYGAQERESFYTVRDAISRQESYAESGREIDARIWVYRAVDRTKNTKEDFFRNGDWVTPSYSYAVNEGKMNPDGFRIIKHKVPIKNLYWDGNSIAELGYDDGQSYAYADTKNNRKLLDPVTYDDEGNIIPLSKRFKKRNEDVRYSLSNPGEDTKGTFFGKDLALQRNTENTEIAPTAENTIPEYDEYFAPSTPELETPTQRRDELEAELMTMPENFDELNEEWMAVTDRIKELEAEENERLESHEEAPPEMEAPYYDNTPITADNPFENRDYKNVGSRNVKAYMYENPEVKPFFQAEAEVMLGELRDATKGERFYNDQLYYDTNGENGWTGTKRLASDDISYLLDSGKGNGKGYSYAEIEAGLKAIIGDHGEENNACSKRIEFILNDRLRDGYTVFGTNEEMPPNQDYIKLLDEKQINEYSKEAFAAYMQTADAYAPVADTAPVAGTAAPVAPVADTSPIAPVASAFDEVKLKGQGNIRGQQVMQEVKPKQNPKTASVLTKEPKPKQKKRNIGLKLASSLIDKGMVFENLSHKTGNMELQAKWDYALPSKAEARAQYFMEKGDSATKSLDAIRKEVGKEKEQQFAEYLYHVHNIDRMTLDSRFGVPNKTVFGDTVTAEESKKIVAAMEEANPAFKDYAQDVYRYNKQLRKLLVDKGVISQETSDLWERMYPHYVPIRRADDTWLNINVPLDTNKTGINAPVKRATGGNSDILPLFDTMAQRTIQTYKAIARNSFGVELKDTLGTTIANETQSVDDVIDSIDFQGELLKAGEKGGNPTFTVFENGERVEFEITEDMYNALKPASGILGHTFKGINAISKARRNLITSWNPVFALYRNPIKDIQDVLINSQHPVKTYKNVPRAIIELARNGSFAAEYKQNGGEQNTYFESDTNTFKAEDSVFKKTIGIPLRALENAGNFIEQVPRLAEYIASRNDGRSIERSMLDAARVTTNFAASGDVTKFANRHGFTFLNASVQGFSQHVRNIREAKLNGLKGWVGLAGKVALAGLPHFILNGLMWEDDEDYEELSDYIKDNYYVIAKTGDGKFIRIPKGRVAAVIQDGFEQMENLITGDDEADFGNFFKLVMDNIAPNNPIENNILAPIGQALSNTTWYGVDLVPTRLQNVPGAEQYDESTDAISKWLGEKTGWSPYKINYLIDQYSGGLGDTFLPMLTPEAESGDDSLVGNLLAPWKKEMVTDNVLNNQNVTDFYDLRDELEINANSMYATEEDKMRNLFMDSVGWDMSDLYKQKREIQNSDMSDSTKYELTRELQRNIDELAKEGLAGYNNVSVDGSYAEVGNRRFNYDPEKDTWYEIQEKNADGSANYFYEQEQKVTQALGISYGEYWNNREEYNFAYDKPERYAIAKAVGGFDSYLRYFGDNPNKPYYGEMSGIKADKDKNGESINGSRKAKIIDYLNELDAEYGEKIILYKSQYPSDDSYNYDIVDYLNGRDDISYAEMEAILVELGFKVDDEGNITW